MKLELSRQICFYNLNIKFHRNPSSGIFVVPCWRTDGQTDTMKLIVAFRNFANAPKNGQLLLHSDGSMRRCYVQRGHHGSDWSPRTAKGKTTGQPQETACCVPWQLSEQLHHPPTCVLFRIWAKETTTQHSNLNWNTLWIRKFIFHLTHYNIIHMRSQYSAKTMCSNGSGELAYTPAADG